jgi:5-methylcytosine-specific restriction endonuclease McrA
MQPSAYSVVHSSCVVFLIMSTFKKQYESPKWQKKRLEIMKRDDFTCQLCGATDKQLDVHHIYYEKDKMIWELDNECYVTLCKDPCHKEAHTYIKKLSSLIAWNVLKLKIDFIEIANRLKVL